MKAQDLGPVSVFFFEFDKLQLQTWTVKWEPKVRRVAAIEQEMKLDGHTETRPGPLPMPSRALTAQTMPGSRG